MLDGPDLGSPTERELRLQLEAAQAITHIGSWKWDLASGVVTWSDELYRIYGLVPRSQPITLEFFLSRIHTDERERIQREIQNALQTPGRFAYRERVVRTDGSTRTLDTIGEVLVDEQGAATGLFGTCRDITGEARHEETLRFYADVFNHVEIGLSAWQLDTNQESPTLRLVAFNAATEALTDRALGARLGQSLLSIFPAFAETEILQRARSVFEGASIQKLPSFQLDPSPSGACLDATLFALPGRHVGLALEDVTAQKRSQSIQAGEREALEMLASNAPIAEILAVIVTAIERVSPGMIGSVLMIDETGTHLLHGTAAGLPDAYNHALHGQAVGPRAGSCGTAAYRREPVYVSDIETDPLWEDYRELAREHGLRACWSSPVLSNDGRVLGTFALYHREPREPDAPARELMSRASHIAGIALERRALDDQLRALAARLEAIREDERTTIARDIHDQLGQSLTAMKLDIAWLARRIQEPVLERKLGEMTRAADEVINTVRRISADLRPGILDDLGLRAAIEWQAEDFQTRTGTRCTLTSAIGDLRVERGLATTVFRIFQESLTNVARHAGATSVDITLELVQGHLHLTIADDGVGLPDVGPRSTLGILGMGERARRIGGDCVVKRRIPRGTIVSVTVPLRFPSERILGA